MSTMTTPETVKINEKQVETFIETGYQPKKATLVFVSNDEDDYFEVKITLSNGVVAQFIGDRGAIRRYRNPTHFLHWAKKHSIPEVEFETVNSDNIILKARRETDTADETRAASK